MGRERIRKQKERNWKRIQAQLKKKKGNQGNKGEGSSQGEGLDKKEEEKPFVTYPGDKDRENKGL